MKEVSGRGFYPGPSRQHGLNKTDYGNAVWQRCINASNWQKQYAAQEDKAKA
ncbi:MAG: hypothetical protein WCD66_12980 [Rhodanobacteraceae bacterium]